MTTRADTPSDAVANLLARVEERRQQVGRTLDGSTQRQYGQFFTPLALAQRIAAQPRIGGLERLKILDPGAGVGMLAAVLAARAILEQPERSIEITAVEIDHHLRDPLEASLEDCRQVAGKLGVDLEYAIEVEDFIPWGTARAIDNLYAPGGGVGFDVVIQNPPYGKVGRASVVRKYLTQIGVEVPNIYAAFLAISTSLLDPDGQLVAITPRSFCNGAYFRNFREFLLSRVGMDKVAVFHERGTLFSESSVLQETIIFSGTRGRRPDKVTISTSRGHLDQTHDRLLPYDELVHPGDGEMFIRVPTDEDDDRIGRLVAALDASLPDLGVQVSTGKVVDFRSKDFIRQPPADNLVPLLYPRHLKNGRVAWPVERARKPDGIEVVPETEKMLLPPGVYVLVKRLSAKEEVRRVVASLYRPRDVTEGVVGFENHLNVFHSNNNGMDERLAVGLTLWLNSSLLDLYFRQFSGHTQVNATDLRAMRYPRAEVLESLGKSVDVDRWPDQDELDALVERCVLVDDIATLRSGEGVDGLGDGIREARELLGALNFDAERSNERSALVLLALANLGPSQGWQEASNPMLRTVDIMDFLRQQHGRDYKPNTRETIRRQTLHQFAEAGLIVQNPDKPDRPINSPRSCYQLADRALEVVRSFKSPNFDSTLPRYLADLPGLRERYAAEREMRRIPVVLPSGDELSLSQGGQNPLIRSIIKDFCSYYTPGGEILYIGDADEKWRHFERGALEELGVVVDRHGKMPDLVVYMREKNWLVLLEAVTSHGPIDAKRHGELQTLFAGSSAGLVFVTCFPDRSVMREHLRTIAWETEVWCADNPTHMIHFDGERFLGPYK